VRWSHRRSRLFLPPLRSHHVWADYRSLSSTPLGPGTPAAPLAGAGARVNQRTFLRPNNALHFRRCEVVRTLFLKTCSSIKGISDFIQKTFSIPLSSPGRPPDPCCCLVSDAGCLFLYSVLYRALPSPVLARILTHLLPPASRRSPTFPPPCFAFASFLSLFLLLCLPLCHV